VAEASGVLAIVPARAGSKGIPNKNLRQLAGLPLFGHALRFAALCPEITRTVVSTDSEEIARAARELGGDVPFVRPAELAADDTPTWPVLRHALGQVDPTGDLYGIVVLLEPTSPVREPGELARALGRLADDPGADGVVGVAEPDFNPVWETVVERDGYMTHVFAGGAAFTRRQDAPRVYVISGSLYAWRASFMRTEKESWFNGRLLLHVLPPMTLLPIDAPHELERLQALLDAGLVALPWVGS
jgi:CMP-N,N'-diacetyllegionaminic acid synthase